MSLEPFLLMMLLLTLVILLTPLTIISFLLPKSFSTAKKAKENIRHSYKNYSDHHSCKN